MRLDRLLGPNEYAYRWRLNQYHLDAWRPLEDVSNPEIAWQRFLAGSAVPNEFR